LNATEAAAAVSSDVLIPLFKTSTKGGRMDSSAGAASIHFENAPMVEQTENIYQNIVTRISRLGNLFLDDSYSKVGNWQDQSEQPATE
jgi:hypothetical protein